jgi:DNA-binding MarR family transcriptional regulator
MMEHSYDPERLVFKLLYILKRQTDSWADSKIGALVPGEFNLTFMPYFMNIGNEGISNHDLVNKIRVTKQGVSKTIKELERLKLVYTSKNEKDARSIMINLTEQGKDLHEAIRKMGDQLTNEYVQLLGEKKYGQFIDSWIKLSNWHENQEK